MRTSSKSQNPNEQIYICVSGEEPEPKVGFFSVSITYQKIRSPLAIFKDKNGYWTVWFEGSQIASPSLNWKEAFGWIFSERGWGGDFLKGERITKDKYTELVKSKLTQYTKPSGHIDQNETPIGV